VSRVVHGGTLIMGVELVYWTKSYYAIENTLSFQNFATELKQST